MPIAKKASYAPQFGTNRRLELEDVLAMLLGDGWLTEDEARRARAARSASRNDVHPLVVLANLKLPHAKQPGESLTLDTLTEWIAGHAKLPHYRIDPTRVEVSAVSSIMTAAYAARYRILPVEIDARSLTVATSEPFDTRWLADVANLTRREIHRVVANPLDVHRYTMEFFGISRSVQKAQAAKGESDAHGKIVNFEQLVELGNAGELGADDQHIVHIVDWLLQYAYEQRASDIHLEPRRDTSRVRFRIDGVLHKVFELPTVVMAAVTARTKILGRMDIAERRRPQDGRIKMRAAGGREVEMRLSTMPTAFGEKVVMRIFDPDVVLKPFRELGLSEREEAVWLELVHRPNGIVLVTGPTGSGKTTTLYTTLRMLATPDVNVCTVEDPIEMVVPTFNQTQVQASIGLDFAAGVRTLLRQDPDIIMVGEIRDLETAQMAVQASLTGHLVLSTLHTNDAPSAITRLLDLGVPHYLIQSTLAGVVAQRLVRRLCAKCSVEVAIDDDAWQVLAQGRALPKPAYVRAPKGCPACRNTGFLGRIALYEMLPITTGLRRLIASNTDLAQLKAAAASEGFRPLRVGAAQQVAAGVTTIAEALTVLPPID
ncbi:MAG TPA: GspE/PulE family protein [Candidatus Saccharimonadia bacterium]|nr:GspE/PulE family protein [Candidatus Saccharimonadia bacterium]